MEDVDSLRMKQIRNCVKKLASFSRCSVKQIKATLSSSLGQPNGSLTNKFPVKTLLMWIAKASRLQKRRTHAWNLQLTESSPRNHLILLPSSDLSDSHHQVSTNNTKVNDCMAQTSTSYIISAQVSKFNEYNRDMKVVSAVSPVFQIQPLLLIRDSVGCMNVFGGHIRSP